MTTDFIWPWWVRLAHWLLALGVLLIWLLVYAYYETDYYHRLLGYAMLCSVFSRLLGAFFTSNPAAELKLPTPEALSTHIHHIKHRQLPPVHGHNPLGQLAVYVIWVLIILLALSGWLSQTDAYWGEAWLLVWHQALSWVLMLMVVLHLMGVVIMSALQKQNLINTMMTKRYPKKVNQKR